MSKGFYLRYLLVSALLLMACGMSAIKKPTKVYLFGFTTSFNDSTVYLSNLQTVDSAWVDSKTHFLYSRDNYSYQLRDYLTGKGVVRPTVITMFGEKKSKVEKQYSKIRKRFVEKNHYHIEYIADDEFHFTAIQPDKVEKELTKAELKELKATQKKEKKASKAAAKAKKREAKEQSEAAKAKVREMRSNKEKK